MNRRELMFEAATDPGRVSDVLATRWKVSTDPATSSRWTCLDTADWRLHRAGMTLRDARHGRWAELVLSTGSEPITAPARAHAWPNRLDALPPSAVRERISSTVGVRALLPLAQVDVRSTPMRLLDDAEKTRVRLRIDQQSLGGASRRALPLRVLITALRGYERDARRCADLLTDVLAQVDALPAATIAMTAAGHVPGQPTAPALRLDAGAPAAESLAHVLRWHADVIDAVRPGVLDDIDPEYLHEMRTAVRATRSMLDIARDLIANTQTARFAADFAWLGQLTTPVRDLDVYLLELAGQGEVDVAGLDDLAPLRRLLARRRTRALRTLRIGLRSDPGERLSAEWRRALDALSVAYVGGPTTDEIGLRYARRAHRQIVKAAAGLTADSPADELHRLRRRCKRMRYLLQSYESIYDPAPHHDVITRLKKLQDRLGAIQDTDVQLREIAAIAARLSRRPHVTPVRTVLAMGALRDRASLRDSSARSDLARQLRRFCAPSTRATVEAMAATRP